LLAGALAAWGPFPLAAGIVGGTAVLLLTLITPLAGLAFALALGPLGAVEAQWVSLGGLDSAQIMLALTLTAWIGRGLRDGRLPLPAFWLQGPLWLFIYLAGVSLLDASSFSAGLKETLKWVEIGLIIWLVVAEAERTPPPAHWWEKRPLLWVLGGLAAAALFQGALGVWQFAFQPDGPEHFQVLGRFYRAYGTFQQPNPFGGFMNLAALTGLGLTLGGAALVWRRRRRRGVWAWPALAGVIVAGGITAVSVVALLFSWSRGAWLGFAAGLAAIVFFWPRRRRQGAALLLAGGGLVAGLWLGGVLPASLTARVDSIFGQQWQFADVRGVEITDANYAVIERLAHWQAARRMARQAFWLGVGFGNYESAYPEYDLINWPDALGHAHNYYLNLWAEVGILGLSAYLFFWTAVFWQNIMLLRRLDGFRRGIALGLLGVWTALAAHHLVDKLYVNNIYIHLGALLGMMQALARQKTPGSLCKD
jgi:O-antigen ligase